MDYEETPVKKSKGLGKVTALKAAEQLGTSTLLWLVVKRHKVGLMGTWAVIMTILYVFPAAPDVLLSLF